MGRMSAEDGAALVAAWRASGLSKSAYARQQRIAAHRLSYWASRSKLDDVGFVEITEQVSAASKRSGGFELHLPSGCRCHWHEVPAMSEVARLLQEVG